MEIKIKYYILIFVKKSLYILKEIFLNIASLLSVLIQSDFFYNDFKRIKVIKFDEFVIIGNGPSLNETFKENINFFNGKTIACVNNFATSEYFGVIKPDFYFLLDSVYWSKNISSEIRYLNEQSFQLLKEKVSWPITIIMPLVAKQWSWFIDLPKLNKNINFCYVNLTRIFCSKSLRYFLYSKNLAMPRCVNVLINAAILAINMGYKKIFLVGADHSWHESIIIGEDNVVYYKNEHCYSGNNISLSPFFTDVEEIKKHKIHEFFHILSLMFEGHQDVAEYAKYAGAKVYNVSKKSYIDAYERLTLK